MTPEEIEKAATQYAYGIRYDVDDSPTIKVIEHQAFMKGVEWADDQTTEIVQDLEIMAEAKDMELKRLREENDRYRKALEEVKRLHTSDFGVEMLQKKH